MGSVQSSISCRLPPVVMSHLPSYDYEGFSRLQEEATYEVVDQPRPPPLADYQLSAEPVQLMHPLTATQRTSRHYNNTV